jgi:CheY-like chemotaxis protein
VLVLVIEDDELVRRALVALLGGWGLRVAEAPGFQEARQQVADGVVPSVIISDYRLRDGQDGIEVVRLLRTQLGCTLPACLMSGDTDPGLMQAAQVAGLTLLHKPVRPAKLRSLLRRLLLDQRDGVDLP